MRKRRRRNSAKSPFKLNLAQTIFSFLLGLFSIYLLISAVNYGLTQRKWDNGGLVEYTGKCISQYYESHAHRNNECFLLDNGEIAIAQSRVLVSAGFDKAVFEKNIAKEMTFIYTPHRNFGSRYQQIVGIRLENACLMDEAVTKADHKSMHITLIVLLILCIPVLALCVAPRKLFACIVAVARAVSWIKHRLCSKSASPPKT